jgi:molybdenum cofactor guanylyltransferase
MLEAAAIVLAGGRSSRMGSPKAELEWHGSTLLRRVTGLLARAVDGPVVAVGASGQHLPPLGPGVELASDARVGRGPMQGIAAGMGAIGDRADVAYVSSTDAPLLHPAFVRRVVGAFTDDVDVVLPELRGYRQPLAAAYRLALLGTIEELIGSGRLRPGFLFERCRVLQLNEEEMLSDPALSRLDPDLASVINLNEPADYQIARALPAPEIEVQRLGTLAAENGQRVETARAWTLGELADEIGVPLDDHVVATVGGEEIGRDGEFPLVRGDTVGFNELGPRRRGTSLRL